MGPQGWSLFPAPPTAAQTCRLTDERWCCTSQHSLNISPEDKIYPVPVQVMQWCHLKTRKKGKQALPKGCLRTVRVQFSAPADEDDTAVTNNLFYFDSMSLLTYFPRAKHSSLTVAPLAASTDVGKCTSILGSYSPMTPAKFKTEECKH